MYVHGEWISSKQSRASSAELAAAPEMYSLRTGKTPHMANPLKARMISAPDSSDTCFIKREVFTESLFIYNVARRGYYVVVNWHSWKIGMRDEVRDRDEG